MPLRVQCPNGCAMRVPSNRAGMSARCPGCKSVVVVPFPAADHRPEDVLQGVIASSSVGSETVELDIESSSELPEPPLNSLPDSSKVQTIGSDSSSERSKKSKRKRIKKSSEKSASSSDPTKKKRRKKRKKVKPLEDANSEARSTSPTLDRKPKLSDERDSVRSSTVASDAARVSSESKSAEEQVLTPLPATHPLSDYEAESSPGLNSKPQEKEALLNESIGNKTADELKQEPQESEASASFKPLPDSEQESERRIVESFEPLGDESKDAKSNTFDPVSISPRSETAKSKVVQDPLPPIEVPEIVASKPQDALPQIQVIDQAKSPGHEEFSTIRFDQPKPKTPEPNSDLVATSAIEIRAQRANADRVTLTRFFAALLVFVGLVNFAPAIYCWYSWSQTDVDFLLPRWIYLQIFIAVLHLVYAILLIQVPDWSTLRSIAVVMLAFAFVFGLFSMGLLTTGSNGVLAQFLQVPGSLSRQACIWCVAMLCLATLASYLAGRESSAWQRTEKLLAEILSGRASG